MPDQIYGVTWNGAEKVSYTYDPLGRLTNRKVASFSNAYTYEDVGEDKTTTLVQSVVTPAGTYGYTYDNIGNILSITDGTYTSSYEYDSLNQLVRANDARAGKTYTYSYSNGNITEQKEYAYTTGELGEVLETKNWTYGDSVWSDLLTDFNGTAITYDEVGNPLTIGSKELSWLGRQLTQITDGEEEISYAYNGDGQRVSKTVNGTTTEFIYNGDILAGQKTGDDILVFMYDNNGDPFGFICNGTEYYYIKNAQNDVTAIASADGTIIANYYYDPWGKLTEITGDTEIAELNPIRYRSYYYDSETEWYYLNTRYYSPELCRFINADNENVTVSNLTRCTDKHLYAYCDNNPLVRVDDEGDFWHIVVGAVVGAAIGAISEAAAGGDWRTILVSTAAGALSGGLACTGLGVGALVAANVAISAGESFINQTIKKGVKNVNYAEVAFDGAVGGLTSAIGGKGSGSKHLNNLGKQATKRIYKSAAKQGAKSGVKQASKAVSYYAKSTKNYYKDYAEKLIKGSVIDWFADSLKSGLGNLLKRRF